VGAPWAGTLFFSPPPSELQRDSTLFDGSLAKATTNARYCSPFFLPPSPPQYGEKRKRSLTVETGGSHSSLFFFFATQGGFRSRLLPPPPPFPQKPFRFLPPLRLTTTIVQTFLFSPPPLLFFPGMGFFPIPRPRQGPEIIFFPPPPPPLRRKQLPPELRRQSDARFFFFPSFFPLFPLLCLPSIFALDIHIHPFPPLLSYFSGSTRAGRFRGIFSPFHYFSRGKKFPSFFFPRQKIRS